MRSKSPRKTRSAGKRKSGSRTLSAYQKWVKAHKAQITAAVKAAGHTGKNFIKYYAKTAKKMAMEAGVQMKPKSPKMRKAKTASPKRRARVSALRKLKAGVSQSAEQKLRALFSRTPSRYALSKKGSRVVRKRRASRKAPKLTKSGKVRKTRKLSAYNLWFKQHKAQVAAEVERRGMKGQGIKPYAIVGYEMYKASM
jgi:hypothetical protein